MVRRVEKHVLVPERVRQLRDGFSWIDRRFVREGLPVRLTDPVVPRNHIDPVHHSRAGTRRTPPSLRIKPPNAFGIHDVHGNVSEWCADASFHLTYEGTPVDGSVWIARGDARYRVNRGGYYAVAPWFTRSACRAYDGQWVREPWIGVRPARSITSE